MPSNYDEFERQINKAAEGVVDQLVELHRTITLKAYRYITADSRTVSLQYGSPVWTGRFRGSFNVSIGAPNFSTLPPHPQVGEGLKWPDEPSTPYRAQGVNRAAAQLLGLQPFSTTYIANGVPYARRLENGYSLKAPSGVLGLAVAKVAKEVNQMTIKIS